MKSFLNIATYQLIWFLCVLGGNTWAWGGLVLLLCHLYFSKERTADLIMMGLLLIIGWAIDGTLLLIGFFSFTESGFPIPFWLMVIWLALAITPHHGLSWMKNRPILAVIFGALGGPAAYWAGVHLGAATFNSPLVTSLLTLAVIWAILWVGIMYVSIITGKLSITLSVK